MTTFQPAWARLPVRAALIILATLAHAAEVAPAANPFHLPPGAASLGVVLSVEPAPAPFPYGSSPTVGTQIKLTATLPHPVIPSFSRPRYLFVAVLSPSGQSFVVRNLSPASQVVWTPPKAGDYQFKVYAVRGSTWGTDAVNDFHVRPAMASNAQLFANPSVMSLPGTGSFSGSVSLPMPTTSWMWFGYLQDFAYTQPPPTQVWSPLISTSGGDPAVWNPAPPLAPGAFFVWLYAQTFVDNVLMAEGYGTMSAADFYRGHYIVLTPPSPCPAATPTADPTQPFGWLTPITVENALGLAVGAPQGAADCAIAGHTINDIANDPQLRVRTINVACANCHTTLMAGAPGKDWFCNVLPNGFMHSAFWGEPTPETMLYKLFANWWTRGCPD